MSKITTLLGPSMFEVARDKIASILADELSNQGVLAQEFISNPPAEATAEDIAEAEFILSCIPSRVFVDRFTRPTVGELEKTWLNVVYGKRKAAMNQSATNQQADNMFMIEGWSRGISSYSDGGTIIQRGDTLSVRKLCRTLGMCSKILQAKCYRQLDMPRKVGVLSSVPIDIAQPEYGAENKENMIFGSTAVIAQLNDTAYECTGGVLAAGVDTEMQVNGQDGIYWKVTF